MVFPSVVAYLCFNRAVEVAGPVTPGVVCADFVEAMDNDLGTPAALGRPLLPADAQQDAVVLSDRFWRSHFAADPTILGPLAAKGMHTLTYFGVHLPPEVFEGDMEAQRDEAVSRVLDAINEHLEEPIENCLALDANGKPCLEAKTPQDIDQALAMPGGHIFHGDLEWPWAPNRARLDTPAQRWGVQTDVGSVLVCGSGIGISIAANKPKGIRAALAKHQPSTDA